jgi:hypothetical protein
MIDLTLKVPSGFLNFGVIAFGALSGAGANRSSS